ncbi:hypothetical protein LBMAG27_18130 [Bacteroidota bacterium]|nr:hypothetical protein LBMAG27_18130 [Bacteroidota bacterium]
MKFFSQKSIGVILLFAAFISISATVKFNSRPGDKFKNLKVLPKDISDEDLDKVMDGFKEALGVKCGFCHARNADTTIHKLDFASDANEHKDIARYMMTMANEINANYFNWEKSTRPDTIHAVRCITCHRGLKEPGAEEIGEQMKLLSPQIEKK